MQLTERYSKQISGILHCYDRVIVQGTYFRNLLCRLN